MHNALAIIALHPDKFRRDFYEYILENWHVYQAFEREADKIRARGRTRYSQRTIWEVLRHESALREADSEYKLNDHYCKGCAVLYTMLHPYAPEGFFEFRERKPASERWYDVGAMA